VAGPLTTGLVVGPAHEGLVACPLLVPFQGLPCARANNGAMSLTACVSARAARWPEGRRAALNYASPFHALCYVTLTDDTDRDGMVSSLPAPICDSAQRTLTIFLGPGNSCHKAPDSSLCTNKWA
jgi:hypothetical protein